MVKKGHYPNFDVMEEQEHWDPHTRKIVNKRLNSPSFYPYQFFTEEEANTLRMLCTSLLHDSRAAIISYVIHQLDTTLHAGIGESQRKVGIPKKPQLIRDGLALFMENCMQQEGMPFDQLEEKKQMEVIDDWMQGKPSLKTNKKNVPIKDFMQLVFADVITAYYSHPSVWSEIGYAGPAYPRGYVRSELGVTDPWEARKDD